MQLGDREVTITELELKLLSDFFEKVVKQSKHITLFPHEIGCGSTRILVNIDNDGNYKFKFLDMPKILDFESK